MGRLAILAGSGRLPVLVQENHPDAIAVTFWGMPSDVVNSFGISFEKLGGLFEFLKEEGVTQVCMVGGLSRPQLDPSAFDDGMKEIAPRLMHAMAGGDDGLLREVIAIFEERGFEIVGVHDLLPNLTAPAGVLTTRKPSDVHLGDIKRADAILSALAPVDVGQAVVVEGGICLGIEAVQGTDALLAQVAETPDALRSSNGVLVKRPKLGQDLRVDMPTIGPDTVQNTASAGLAGIAITVGQVLLVDREQLIGQANSLGLFIIAEDPS